MFARAASAESAGDPRWAPLAPESLPEDIEDVEGSYLAFWVAAESSGEVAGIIGVRGRLDPVLLAGCADAKAWLAREDIAELCHLRVAPERWRQGIGRGLVGAVVAWAPAARYRKLVLNTTTPQTPAVGLYESQGFRVEGVSYFGQYELDGAGPVGS